MFAWLTLARARRARERAVALADLAFALRGDPNKLRREIEKLAEDLE